MNLLYESVRQYPRLCLKFLIIMKLTAVFLITLFLQIGLAAEAQQVTLNVRNASLHSVLTEIRSQTGYDFLVGGVSLANAHPVSINVRDASLEETLQRSFKDQPFTYRVSENAIVVSRKPPPTASVGIAKPVQRAVSGTVVDEAGAPLEGVTVRVKDNPLLATTTGANGLFTINTQPNTTLVFSSVGFVTQEVNLGDETQVEVVMLTDQGTMEEVVVVAFGTQKKISVTGAIASIQTKEIKQSPAANLAVTLAGRLPGLTALQRSGEPGRDHTALFLRGMGTLNATAPIILVDGVEREMTYIDPNEVESVSILKDASSTALFGVRGANGVILVTTKRGTTGQPSIGLTYEHGLQGFTRSPSVLSSYEWAS